MITHERIGDGAAKVGLERFGRRKMELGEDGENVKMEVKLEEGVEETYPNLSLIHI